MYRSAIKMLLVFVAGILILSGCRPPELEGTVLYIQKEQYSDALAQAKEAVAKYPDVAEGWFYLGWLSAEQEKDYDTMNSSFAKALELDPAMKVQYKGGKIDIKTAIQDYRGNMFTENFNSAIKIIPQAQELEGEAKTKKLMEAREKLELATMASPERFEPYRPLALTYLFAGDTTGAESALEKGLAGNPENEDLLVSAGEIYSLSGKNDRAKELLEKVLSINAENGMVYQRLGNIASQEKDWDKANEYFGKAIELDPDNKDLAFNIAVSYYNRGQLKEAAPFFEKTLAADPEDVAVYEILGRCYVAGEMYDEAHPFLEGAVEKFPDNGDLWEFLAITYGQKGMSDKADEAFKKSKELKGE